MEQIRRSGMQASLTEQQVTPDCLMERYTALAGKTREREMTIMVRCVDLDLAQAQSRLAW